MTCANHPDRERTAFCQNCGKPICQECTRTVGTSVFCEPCLAARIAPPPAGGGSYTYTGGPSYTVGGPMPPGGPNPALAALLGIIPGVGAMYNGQFAKGIVHLVIFAVLVSLSHENGIFGLFIAGWVCYQIIEAYHTARARRDGTPLPNPFGLNDLGERLGFGKSWAATHPSAPTEQPPAASTVPPTGPYSPPASQYSPPTQRMPWDTQWTDYVSPGTPTTGPGSPAWTAAPAANPYTAPPVPPTPPDDTTTYRNRFPMGAIWLIGLGLLFLIGNAGLFHGFPMHQIIPFFLIGLGVWLFIHKMTLSGPSLADDGSTYYRVRLFSALRGSIWVILVGVMFLLSSFGILSWGRSWPLFIIVAGLMAFFERTAYSSAAAPGGPWYPPQQPPAPPAPPAETRPSSTNDQEER
jgi:hypothetical protein